MKRVVLAAALAASIPAYAGDCKFEADGVWHTVEVFGGQGSGSCLTTVEQDGQITGLTCDFAEVVLRPSSLVTQNEDCTYGVELTYGVPIIGQVVGMYLYNARVSLDGSTMLGLGSAIWNGGENYKAPRTWIKVGK
ncbi:MAG: hypothetical protein ABJK25_00015 [Halieaceae bacterium]